MASRAVQPTGPRITPEETERLFYQYSIKRSDALRNQIAEGYLYVASIIASKFSGRGIDYDDLFQVASLSLLKAVERFDPAKGVKFVSFATPTMVGEVKNYFRDRSRLIRMPRKSGEMIIALENAKAQLAQQLLRSPTAEELAEYTQYSVDEVLETLEMAGASSPTSLDATLEDDESSLHGILGFQDMEYDRFETRDLVLKLLMQLTDTERMVLTGRYYEGMSQRDIANQLDVSQMTVSRIERKALATLRGYMMAQTDGNE